MNIDRIPLELRERKQWLTWYYDEKGAKVPVGKTNEPRTWHSFNELKVEKIAYVFSESDLYTGIDLDDCISDGGDWADEAIEIMGRFAGVAYAEISPSGTGVKLITRAKKPVNSISHNRAAGVECYDKVRFWTMTCDTVQGYESIGDGQAAVDWLCEKYLKRAEPPIAKKTTAVISPKELQQRAGDYLRACTPAVAGQRNNKAFSIAGHLFAMVGINGERLSENEVLDFLICWNNQLIEPLSVQEIQKVVQSAARSGTPREDKLPEVIEHEPILDIDWESLNAERTEDFDDEQFCESMVPPVGLLKDIFDYYSISAHRRSPVMGLAVAVSLCQLLLGRRVMSQTDLRTNDYNVILAPTTSGKEACEKTIIKILEKAAPAKSYLLPPDVQSGNGLIKAICMQPLSLWICDEFGKVLEAVLDRKHNSHIKAIGTHLLKLYGKSESVYGGAAHSDGVRNRIIQPHLCVLGLSTNCTVFNSSVDSTQINDGLFGRIAFWPVQSRPKRKQMERVEVPDQLADSVRQWLEWEPTGLNPDYPAPAPLLMSAEAFTRWERHADAIDEKMESESESRAAIWGRAAARTMKLAMVSRCSRLGCDPAKTAWDFVLIELQDVEWAVKLSNWLAGVACDLIKESIPDTAASRAESTLLAALTAAGEHGVSREAFLRKYRSITAGELTAAVARLERNGGVTTKREVMYRRPKVTYYLSR